MKYLHSCEIHNLQSPRIVVPLIVEDSKPQSVVVFGCGLGTWISEFKRSGVQDVLGLDGSWVDKTYFEQDVLHNFMVADLESPIRLDRKFDLAISLEVAEHLDKKSARSFVASLTMA
jgi:2-polyprenyl-3-methyl-5-hydroxy-6-metoxy-1,4-benzoquinol methylase